MTFTWVLIEFLPFLGINVQRFSNSQASSPTNQTITAVDLNRAFILYNVSSNGTARNSTSLYKTTFVDSTTMRMQSDTGNASSIVDTQVVEHPFCRVQSVTTSVTGATASPTIPNPVNADKTWLIGSGHASGASTIAGNRIPIWFMDADGEGFQYERFSTTDTYSMHAFVVEFIDSTRVFRFTDTFEAGNTTRTTTFTNVFDRPNSGLYINGILPGSSGTSSNSLSTIDGNDVYLKVAFLNDTQLTVIRINASSSLPKYSVQIPQFFQSRT